jgi:hypothetical protein
VRANLSTAWRGPGVKPPPGTPINAAHPLAKGLIGFWIVPDTGGQLVQDSVTGIVGGSAVSAGSPIGQGAYGIAQAPGVWTATPISYHRITTVPFTIMAIATLANSAFQSQLFSTCGQNSCYSGAYLLANGAGAIFRPLQIQFGQGANPGSGNDNTQRRVWGASNGTFSLPVDGPHVFAGSMYDLAGNGDVYCDGAVISGGSSGGTASGIGYIDNSPPTLGGSCNPPFSSQTTVPSMVCAALWNRALSAQEHLALAQDPFGMFAFKGESFGATPPAAGFINAPFVNSGTSVYVPTLAGGTAVGTIREQSASIG